jgi:type I restriction enzyme, S subunit
VSRYQAYPEYKDFGVAWLGQLPSHWGAKRLGQFFDERREKVSDEDYPALSVTMQGIVPQLETAAKTDAGDNRKLVLKNDFVINSRSDRKGSSGVSTYDGSVSLISIVMTPRNIHPPFVHHLLRSYPFQEEFYRYGKGIVADLWSTNSSEMRNILIPDMPTSEQANIAEFLDHETAKIDALIEKQQRLIELLKEKRQAVISHAVTKGLNPNAPMKDSGVEWVESVPAHWRVSKLGYHASVSNGATPSRENMLFWENGTIGWLNSSKVNDEVIQEADQFITKFALSRTSVKPVNRGDLLMAITGEGQTRGRVAICNIEATINQHLAAISICDKLLHHEFLYLWLEGNYERIRYESEGAGSTKGAITCSEISAFPVILPPLEEQDLIVGYVAERKSKFDRLMREAYSAIELIQERRTALISAAVTGKIDVRDWQPAA